jgi:prepilin-type N-terminal cleavage/methylation domain-containing protein
MKNFKCAFTLAEVLITLGVIGVVAAITMPVLSKMYKKAIAKNQIKQAYSLISNAVNSVTLDDEYPHGCYYGVDGLQENWSECGAFFDGVISKLETTKICENNSFENGCVPDYKIEDFTGKASCGGFKAENIKLYSKSAVLKNGITIFIYGGGSLRKGPIIAFDINGFKGPNKPGYDVYAMRLQARQPGFPVYGLSDNSIINCFPVDSSMLFTNIADVLK